MSRTDPRTRWPSITAPAGYAALLAAIDGRAVPCQAAPRLWLAEAEAAQEAAAHACQPCPALDACRSYALSAREKAGVWGGLTPTDREQARAATRKEGRR